MSDNSLSKTVAFLIQVVFIVNTLLVVLLAFLGYSAYNSGIKQISEIGNIALNSFNMSTPRIWSIHNYDNARNEFVNELKNLNSVKNFIVYNQDITMFEYGKYDFSQIKIPPPGKPLVNDDLLIFYNSYETNMHAKNKRMSMHKKDDSKYYITFAVDASYIKNNVIFYKISLFIACLMELLLIIFSLRLKKLINNYEQTSSKMMSIQQEAITGRFANILAHEIKNPLSSIKGFIGFCLKKALNDEIRENLEYTLEELDRLNTIVNSFLTFGKPLDLNKTLFNAITIINKAELLLSYDISISGKKILISGNDFEIYGDFDKILQVVVNLLVNALEASPYNGEITIKLSDKHIIITNPVNKEKQQVHHDRYFEPFYTTKSKGSGLGLAISKKLLNLQGFSINITSTVPFTVTLDFIGGGYDTHS